MRLLLFALLLLTAFTVRDQNDQLFDKRWYFGYMRLNGQAVEPPLKTAPAKRPWMYFGKDGAYQQGMDGQVDKGIWKLNKESGRIITTVTGRNGKPDINDLRLLKVTADSLELEDPDGAVLGMLSK
ncbi:hypothetical protein EPD60_04645 [Flaviaesturariibacter flavus]|uniref:Lipocalin-like domain-containing protein n=1 Tax=Flaviaesturariibacter flavus TaxID=2502780 RepID=A0A4R1BJH2_9BACT|nr:hypothetical protein [Flaviaesturariibacter flavus]TCJ17483.1 hypothetical protein EPD60_04645 [Flaviaesturariibacter flavus]